MLATEYIGDYLVTPGAWLVFSLCAVGLIALIGALFGNDDDRRR